VVAADGAAPEAMNGDGEGERSRTAAAVSVASWALMAVFSNICTRPAFASTLIFSVSSCAIWRISSVCWPLVWSIRACAPTGAASAAGWEPPLRLSPSGGSSL
jgi:hypothetical protein